MITGGYYRQLLSNLIWMPAHTTAARADYRVKSNSKSLTTAEWRADQLADALAKRGAGCSELPDKTHIVIKAAGAALLQSAARLGVVTLAANAHVVTRVKDDGTQYSLTKRDSTAMPQALAKSKVETRQRTAAALEAKQPGPRVPLRVAKPLVPPTLAQARGKRRRAEEHARKLREDEHLREVVAETAARGTPQPVSAADRFTALRRRLALKNAPPDSG